MTTDKRAQRRLRGEEAQPEWANAVVDAVAALHNRSDRPRLGWKNKPTQEQSTGVTYTHYRDGRPLEIPEVHINAGTDRMYAMYVLVHELCHWIAPRHEHHGAQFYRLFWRTVVDLKLPLNYIFIAEGRYKQNAMLIGQQMIAFGPKVTAYVAGYWSSGRRINNGFVAFDPIKFSGCDPSWLMLLGYTAFDPMMLVAAATTSDTILAGKE
jgi:hypothetical protein